MISGWTVQRIGAAALLAMIAAMATGCNDTIKAENDALRAENEELRMTLNAKDMELAEKDQRIADLETTPMGGGTATGTGFEGIEGVSVVSGGGGAEVTVRVPGDVLFASGKVDLRSGAKQSLGQIASVLKSQYAGRTIRIEGYTDTDPIKKSKWKDNLELSSMRAMAVMRYLSSQGVSSKSMYAAGMHTRNQQSSKAQSRRVEIVVVME